MDWLEPRLWLPVFTLLTAAAVWAVFHHERAVRQFSQLLREDAASLVDLRYQEAVRRQLEDVQRLTETVIDAGTDTVRGVHLGISRIPFGILETIPVTRDTTRVVRQTHDLISEAVYGSIRGINKSAGKLTRSAIDLKMPQKPAPGDNN